MKLVVVILVAAALNQILEESGEDLNTYFRNGRINSPDRHMVFLSVSRAQLKDLSGLLLSS